jgi:hypothetical protein
MRTKVPSRKLLYSKAFKNKEYFFDTLKNGFKLVDNEIPFQSVTIDFIKKNRLAIRLDGDKGIVRLVCLTKSESKKFDEDNLGLFGENKIIINSNWKHFNSFKAVKYFGSTPKELTDFMAKVQRSKTPSDFLKYSQPKSDNDENEVRFVSENEMRLDFKIEDIEEIIVQAGKKPMVKQILRVKFPGSNIDSLKITENKVIDTSACPELEKMLEESLPQEMFN